MGAMVAARAAMRRSLLVLWVVMLTLVSVPAWAHVGSPDVFEELTAGPYRLFVTVRPPEVIPGIAAIEVRVTGAEVAGISVTPMPLTGEGANQPPTPDAMKRSESDKGFFTGSLWLMRSGSWQVRFSVNGAAGEATGSVPVPAVARLTRKMTPGLGAILAVLGVVLLVGMAGIVGAAVRESRLPPGERASIGSQKRGLIAAGVTVSVLALLTWFGGRWWNVEAANYSQAVYQPLTMKATLTGGIVTLNLTNPQAATERVRYRRSVDDFVLDHGHPIHVYAVREPGLDVIYHLHPGRVAAGEWTLALPKMPAGLYRLYGDVVHANGFPETMVASVVVAEGIPGRPLVGDDAMGLATPVPSFKPEQNVSVLPDGFQVAFDRPGEIRANTAYALRFHLLDPKGKAVTDPALYMGMPGHAAILKLDGSVFAHIHPSGSASMAAMEMAGAASSSVPMQMEPASAEVEFPYGFPTAGQYRVFVQMKHGATVETAPFDVRVE